MKLRFLASLAMFSILSSAFGCSAGGTGSGSKNDDNDNDGSGATGSGAVGNQPNLDPTGMSGTLNLGTGGGAPLPLDPNDPRGTPRPKICDASGKCTCLRLALLGTLDSAADAKDTKPFIDWLNGNSDGTATVTMEATKPTIDATWLSNYDILVVANVNGWTFSADEKAAVETWVKEQIGGIITLTGFVSTAGEEVATSQLVDFAGMGYEATPTAPAAGQSTPVYYKGGTTDLKNCLNMWNGADDTQAAITTAIKFTPQTGTMVKLTDSLDYVGAFIGWAAKAPAGSTVIATDPVSSANMAVALEVDGKGRIFSFGDEWVIFANQWQPRGTPTNMQMDMYNPCWVAASGTEPAFFHSTRTLYQTKQFWYDAINWVAPPSECNFTIVDDDVVVK
jgi:hypothetical protein